MAQDLSRSRHDLDDLTATRRSFFLGLLLCLALSLISTMAQAGRQRVNVQLAGETLCVNMHLLELHTFNHVMDELGSLFKLTPYQRSQTRIYLQSKVGETEILVSSRPHYATTRGIDYVGIPANPVRLSRTQRHARLWLCLFLASFLALQVLTAFLVVEVVVLKPRALRQVRQDRSREVDNLQAAIGGAAVPLNTGAVPIVGQDPVQLQVPAQTSQVQPVSQQAPAQPVLQQGQVQPTPLPLQPKQPITQQPAAIPAMAPAVPQPANATQTSPTASPPPPQPSSPANKGP